jgi:hypothetical protein
VRLGWQVVQPLTARWAANCQRLALAGDHDASSVASMGTPAGSAPASELLKTLVPASHMCHRISDAEGGELDEESVYRSEKTGPQGGTVPTV